ncbi:inositol-3-phosphate synthase [Azospirillum brasilense]|uniref:Inositol-3-phosphate synthase n=1 Tax=Azospirillum brasilense TaxID=192 RepID=A0A6L3AST5_AZOBR|nr:inositol-3-phosphate synthase [Azospirillum brasilense]KAA0678340.1 inositol-3-phosphate synthase [Azospirillum brasilense]
MTSLIPEAPVRLAIAGIGNCASALVQGLCAYGHDGAAAEGLMHERIGGISCADIEVVAAFDVDARKVGRPLGEALLALPNCAARFWSGPLPGGVTVSMGPVLDGVAPHMMDYPDHLAVREAQAEPIDLARTLRDTGTEVLVSYLPVGADRATAAYAQACLDAGCALVNCVPSFIASDSGWAGRFQAAGLPVIGDDVKSQLGATIVHRVLTRLFADRGIVLAHTYQLNTGGNTDFLNMLARDRLTLKKRSKTQAVQSQLDVPLAPEDVHIGPSDYVPWQKDNKVCFLRMEGRGFGGQPVEVELRLSVQDSPNSAGVVIDAVRCAALALRRGIAGPLEEVSAYLMKSPPVQLPDAVARERCEDFIARLERP